MGSRAMGKLFRQLVDDAIQDHELYSLLEDLGRENERPIIQVNNREYHLGLVDKKVMMIDTQTKELLDPTMIVNQVTGLRWVLAPARTGTTTLNADVQQRSTTRQNAEARV